MASTKKNDCAEPSAAPAPSSVLLAATSCVLDCPVEIQVRDGSVYSGIFHTASSDDGYSVVIKKARKIRRGRCNSNGELETLIDTLVVFSCDLVQVIAKEVHLLPKKSSGNCPDSMVESVDGPVGPKGGDHCMEENQRKGDCGETSSLLNCYQNEEKHPIVRTQDISKRSDLSAKETPSESSVEIENRSLGTLIFGTPSDFQKEAFFASAGHPCSLRQEAEDRSEEEMVSIAHNEGAISETTQVEETIHPLEISLDAKEEITKKVASDANFDSFAMGYVKPEGPFSEMNAEAGFSNFTSKSASVSPAPYIPCSTSSLSFTCSNTSSVSAKKSVDGSTIKGSKLNPSARTFQPSCASPAAPSTTLSVASAPFIPSNTTFLPIGGMQPSAEVSSLGSYPASVPTKLVVYNNLASTNYASAQHPRPVVAHCGNRSLMARSNTQLYFPVHMGSAYPHSVSQTALADRAVHHLYMQPLPQDMIQVTLPEIALPPPLPPPPRPLMTPYHFNLPKLQSTPAPAVQLCAAPPVLPGQPQLYPSFAHPLHVVPTIPVPGGAGAYGSKLYP